ncbi:exoribonuclease II [Buchnera aphidicola (Takecallis taiwana)]|uniref:exoribonuclease II n=1 Tax=Buchnera aphidicola TaxID=9 RepID=UPI0031B69139
MLKIKNTISTLTNKKNIHSTDIIGIVKKYNKKFGFLRAQNKGHYFIPEKYIHRVMHGDKILVRLVKKKDKYFAKPLGLIKAFLNIFIGNIKQIGLNFFIQPNYPFLNELIRCNFDSITLPNIKHGNWFFAKLLHHKLQSYQEFHAKLLTFIVSKDDKRLPWKVILSHYNIEYKLPKIPSYDTCFNNKIFRKDLTHLKFITIDDENTKDIDDALFLKKSNNQEIKMIIAIADPTAYISPGSTLDILASKRLFTNYLPGFNIPMLPKELSEDIFALHPNKKKPVLACKVSINKFGYINENIIFFLAWIRSHAKLNYNHVSNWIQGMVVRKPNTIDIANQLNLLHQLCLRRILWRKKYAVIFKDNPEYKFHFSNNQDIIKISIKYRNIAHKMIEEAMLIANISAAKFLSKNLGFGIYNIHSGFNVINSKHVALILKNHGINMHDKKITTLIGFCELHRILNTLPNCYIDNRIRRYQSLGTLSITPKPHFSLGLEEYLTWTSPIRKYSDMINHRLLKNVILGTPSIKPSQNTILNIVHCKRLHKVIKNNIENWLYIIFFQKNNHINQIFKAKIFDILPSGIKARILINGAKVFIPIMYISNIKKELICDQKNGILYLNNKEVYRVSNIITVIITELKIEERLIIAKPCV